MRIPSSQQAYYEQVWNLVRDVPRGKVVTYGWIAKSLPEPASPELDEQSFSVARLVGSAMAASPADVPWHRVINAQGRVSSWADAGKQIRLLEAEGVCFVQGRADLNEHQWHGSDQADPPRQHQLF